MPGPDPAHTAAVQALFIQHLPALRGFVLSLVSDFSLVDDIVQETFVTVNSKAGSFVRGSNFRAWAWTIARYKTLQALENKLPATERLSQEVIEALCANPASETVFSDVALPHLAGCVEKLPPRARQVVELRYHQAHRPPEIARRIGWTVDAVHVTLSRARQTLRDCVQRRISELTP